ncbi:MAG: c-type cytochrome biogenesis protein CcmI, partial [Alphaproteobacteria bacterium]|nr:c-type cytochrome biogenesis protein CcmI [Alphaproteobacteria bacterium]
MSLGLAIALIGLTSLALAILLVPLLLRRQTDLSRESYNIAVYRDQLAEVERDAGRGLIGAEQAEAARAEIGRRILALAPRSAVEPPKSSASFAVAAITVLLLPFAAWLLYARLGMPGLPDEPFAERAAAAKAVAGGAEHLDLGEAIAKIGAHLKEHPEDLTGWLLLARTQVSLGQYAEAVEAYRHAADLSGHRPDIMGDWGEAQVLAANGTVTPEAREA